MPGILDFLALMFDVSPEAEGALLEILKSAREYEGDIIRFVASWSPEDSSRKRLGIALLKENEVDVDELVVEIRTLRFAVSPRMAEDVTGTILHLSEKAGSLVFQE